MGRTAVGAAVSGSPRSEGQPSAAGRSPARAGLSALLGRARGRRGRRLVGGAACALLLLLYFLYLRLAAGARLDAGIVLLLLAAAAAIWVAWTLLRTAAALVGDADLRAALAERPARVSELEREKQLLLRALRELEFDRQMGKISEADYQDIRGRSRARVLGLMRDLRQGDGGLRAQIEAELARRLAGRRGEQGGGSAAGRSSPAVAEAVLCAACRTANDPDALFCKRCGKPLGHQLGEGAGEAPSGERSGRGERGPGASEGEAR